MFSVTVQIRRPLLPVLPEIVPVSVDDSTIGAIAIRSREGADYNPDRIFKKKGSSNLLCVGTRSIEFCWPQWLHYIYSVYVTDGEEDATRKS